ncbi:NAD-dependent epimerase/dehydratase family protein [Candidatus Woesearchaeota archaeon]|nr:NAD-dependent epimerase/dehydratase family protein [Candidatus Woesearchaeota archaeon]
MKKVLVTGGAGFIGSHVVDKLVSLGKEVVVYDNLSTGHSDYLANSADKIKFVKADILDKSALAKSMEEVDFVFHMAAHADVKNNLNEPEKLLQQNTVGTSNVLEAMRMNDVKGIAFPSTGSVYGEPDIHPTPADAPFPVQTSMYGASKLAGEGLLQAYAAGYGVQVFIFRFVSTMGERYSHGCVFDFFKKLKENPVQLEILGDGRQKKSYLYVKDIVDAMFTAIEKSNNSINIFNLGHDDYVEVTPIAEIVCSELGLSSVKFIYTGGSRGWVGDSPFIHLDNSAIKSLGWQPSLSIPEAIKKTVGWLKENGWVIKGR